MNMLDIMKKFFINNKKKIQQTNEVGNEFFIENEELDFSDKVTLIVAYDDRWFTWSIDLCDKDDNDIIRKVSKFKLTRVMLRCFLHQILSHFILFAEGI